MQTTDPRASQFRNRLIGAIVVAVLGGTLVILTLRDYGFATDEATWVWVATDVRKWFEEVPNYGIRASLSQERLQARWHFLEPLYVRFEEGHSNYNLSATMCMSNLGWIGFHWLTDELTSYRMGMAVLFSTCLGAVYWTVASERSHVTGVSAAAAILLTPRIFGHAHLASTETPLCCFWTLSLLSVHVATRSTHPPKQTRWALLFGLTAGMTMASKLTGWFMWFPVTLWLLLFRPAGGWRVWLTGVVLAPMVVLVLTPVLWHHPLAGIVDYLRIALDNPWKITSYYLGECYQDGTPWSSGLIIFGVTTPVALLAGSIVGGVFGLRDRLATLLLLNAVVLMAVRTAGFLPQHDVERQFLAVFYFAAILAAFGAEIIARGLYRALRGRRQACPQSQPPAVVAIIVAGLMLIEPAFDSWTYRAHALSYYNRLAGGLRGASELGFEVSYWYEGVTDDVWQEWLGELPEGSRLFMRPDHPGIDYLKRRGLWPAHLLSVGPEHADYYFLYAKRAAYCIHDGGTGDLLPTNLMLYQQREPALKELRFQGVRLLGLFRVR